ncbi:MAG: leucyl aminopeptidase [Pseudomonadales bacterium]|nr:leucyl aminopeptidase [Pseudomonadales bacterium]
MKHGLFLFVALLITASSSALADQSIQFERFSIPDAGRIVLALQGSELTGAAADVNARTQGALAAAVKEAKFKGKKDKKLTLYGIAPYDRIDLIGVGDEPVDRNTAEDFGGTTAGVLKSVKGGSVQILWNPGEATDEASAARVAFGFRLGSYKFDRYKEKKDKEQGEPATIRILSDDGSAPVFNNDLDYLAKGVYFARDMPSEPGNVIYPESFVARAKALLDGVDVKISVLDEKDLQRLNMEAHYGVGKGSARPPRLLIVEYMGGGDEAPIVLAGKGITFDTGGISLKQNKGMWAMKGDLGGAAVVIGTIYAAAAREEKVNLVALAALAENMPSDRANRPGDVQRTMSGKTIEILSTDAEGRLVLSDAVHYAQVNYEPSVLIDVATLTGAVGRALGDDYAGVFGRHQALIDELMQVSRTANEGLWQLPLEDHHFEQLKSDYADVKNSDTGDPGASTGAAFIGSFVKEEQVWAHLDIASVDKLDKGRPTMPKGFSGWGVRTLDEYLRR